MSVLNLIIFIFTEFWTILTQFDVFQSDLKIIFKLPSKNMPNYTRVALTVGLKYQLVSRDVARKRALIELNSAGDEF